MARYASAISEKRIAQIVEFVMECSCASEPGSSVLVGSTENNNRVS